MIKILECIWIPVAEGGKFTEGRLFTVGIACIENEVLQRSVRMAAVAALHRFPEENAAMYVSAFGDKLTFDQAKSFFPKLITEENFKKG